MGPSVTAIAANHSSPPPRWAVWSAHLTTLVVLPSGLWRIAMALGRPAGYTTEGFRPFQTAEAKLSMVALSVVCELLAFLTIGLVRPWGDVVPRWIPLIGGRVVRPAAAIVPAALGALALTWLWSDLPWWWTYPHDDMTAVGALVVGILYQPLVLWGPLLGAVTFSYYRRHRRGRPIPPAERHLNAPTSSAGRRPVPSAAAAVSGSGRIRSGRRRRRGPGR
ncbi:hypothetical protein [Streptomyces sp. NRRL F-5727]|uniref:hypothetical protein n=1 Tax=Streptomyces sp. NRRL F-5727 TaxID=1463871 RepID=UPI001F3A269B|nr:hypothetical protein [Streptomyces sp. NRRL F-5727]